jgi:Protein of unknown function (DUF3987)
LLDAYTAACMVDGDWDGNRLRKYRVAWRGAVYKVENDAAIQAVVDEQREKSGSGAGLDIDWDEDVTWFAEWGASLAPVTPEPTAEESARLVSAIDPDEEERTSSPPPPEPSAIPVVDVSSPPPPPPPPPTTDQITLDPEAFHGPLGEMVTELIPHTEADPAAMMIQALAVYGVALGPEFAWIRKGGTRHPPTLQTVIVGETSLARKGTGLAMVNPLFEPMTEKSLTGPVHVLEVHTGIASGEKLIDVLAVSPMTVLIESEYVSMLRRAAKAGSTLGPVLRQMFDGGTLDTASRTSGRTTVKAGTYAASLVGHVVIDELRGVMTAADIFGGTANRILWVMAHTPKVWMDEETHPGQWVYDDTFKALGLSADAGPRPVVGEMKFDGPAQALWKTAYTDLNTIKIGGLFGATIARGPAQVLRLAVNYALGMRRREPLIRVDDLRAALAMWRYCRQSAWWVFGPATGDRQLDTLIELLRTEHLTPGAEPWFTGTELRDRVGTTYHSAVINGVKAGLLEKVRLKKAEGQRGRPAELVVLTIEARRMLGLEPGI